MASIGYQGVENCYTYKVIEKNLDSFHSIGYKSFHEVFCALINNKVDYILVPIENSTGGSIYINYDLFYKYHKKYNINILKEFTFQVNHCLYIHSNATIDDIKYVLSHPQALAQCIHNINDRQWISKDSWDTTGSIEEMIKFGTQYACIAPTGMEKYYPNIKPIIDHFNDEKVNITRFYLMSIQNHSIKTHHIHNKFSSYIIIQDEIGILSILLDGFKQHHINLTKIESRPLQGSPFQYIFFIEGTGSYDDIKLISNKYSKLYNYHCLGIFPSQQISDEIMNNNISLKIGIIGFGRFGQFIGKKMSAYGFNVMCTSRTDYTEIANKYNIRYLEKEDFQNEDMDIVILSTSIHSFCKVFDSYPLSFWKNKLVCDVLSVKQYPFEYLQEKIGENILCTHPMFGPDSAKNSWMGKQFVYYPYHIHESIQSAYETFITFWKDMGCQLIRMDPQIHDIETANSQFITHFIGRSLENFKKNDGNISTDGFNALMKIKEHSIHDSWDLFTALAQYNPNSKKNIQTLLFKIHTIYNKLFSIKNEESSTSKIFNKIIDLQKNGKRNIINCGAGVPSWKPPIDTPCEYSTSKGNSVLIAKIIDYYRKNTIFDCEGKDMEISHIKEENIIITPGAKPALYMLINILTIPGSSWIIPIPYWVSYGSMVENCLGEPIFVKTELQNNWECDIETLEMYFRTKEVNGIILSNPCNPTGHLYSDSYMNMIRNLCNKYCKYFIVDEVYLPLTNRKTAYDQSEYTIVVNSFSKRWGIPGCRVGWVIANPYIIKELCSLQSTINTCSPSNNQDIAISLLEENYTPELSILMKSKTEISEILIRKGWTLTANHQPSLYLFPIKDGIDIDELVLKLLDNDLAVIHGKSFGVENGFRMTLWNKQDVLERIKVILEDIL